MLVLSRNLGDSLEFPGLGISVKVLQITRNRVRIGVEAPRDVQIRRNELTAKKTGLPVSQFPTGGVSDPATQLSKALFSLRQLQSAAEVTSLDAILEPLQRVIGELETLEQRFFRQPSESKSTRPRRAVVIDDNQNESRLLSSFLRLKKVQVDSFDNGADAIDHLANHELPDVVLLDMKMPRFDGHWTIREIRNQSRLSQLMVYAVSGTHPSEFGVSVGPGGCDRWFQKPLNPSLLVKEILSQPTLDISSAN